MSSSEKTVLTKPTLTEAQVVELAERLYGLKVSSVQPMPSYDDQNFHILVSENQAIRDHGHSYVLKVMNTADSEDADLIEAQTRAMMFLCEKGFPAPTPIPTIDGKIMSLETIEQENECRRHMIRLLTYLPGTPFVNLTLDDRTFYKMGRTFAQMDKALHEEFRHPSTKSLHREGFRWNLSNFHLLEKYLPEMKEGETRSIVKQVLEQFKEKEFQHPNMKSLQRPDFLWKLSNIHLLDKYLYTLGEGGNRQIVEQIIQQFQEVILPNLCRFHQSLNHGDFSHTNILVQPVHTSADRSDLTELQQQLDISGLLDFSDMNYGYYVFDVAISIMYLMLGSNDPVSAGGHVLSGFESVIPLLPEERNAMFLLVLCRFSQSLVLGRYNALLYPENAEYLLSTGRAGWKCLRQLWSLGQEAVGKIWFETASPTAFDADPVSV
ncbi:hydroxylysine kinase-like isoform X1 [Stegostoma tigrinum]|uniref:hydroxylysine kinase-like isoform X1 n=1 Tax=Stegostoma tigrinum TaxID=3053191 RepID=UPI00202B79E9|nr:hydroxylysine kinase-like isoform X1 [Stegostoma tigrinum]